MTTRRKFLKGLGAAVAAVAVSTRLGETKLNLGDFDTESIRFKVTERYSSGWVDRRLYFHDPNSWYIKTEDDIGLKRYVRRRPEVVDVEKVKAIFGTPS